MNILIAPDSFKDCMKAIEVAESLEKGIRNILPNASIKKIPMADGGEGTVQAFLIASSGRPVEALVQDPLRRDISARYGITADGTSAVIEMAAASGLELLKAEERDPMVTTTFGTGQLIFQALERGCTKILLGIGGSASNDGGMGMASALGVEFLDKEARRLEGCGKNLGSVTNIQMDKLDPRIATTEILVACDVDNPLTGPRGASRVYGPQKGADQETVLELDRGMEHFARLIRNQLGKEVDNIPGAGAAGGLGAGLMAFLGAELISGFDWIARASGLENAIREADLVITGEGKIDGQTGQGKTPFGVARLARSYDKMVIGVAGIVDPGAEDILGPWFDGFIELHKKPATIEWSLKNAPFLLEKAGEKIANLKLR